MVSVLQIDPQVAGGWSKLLAILGRRRCNHPVARKEFGFACRILMRGLLMKNQKRGVRCYILNCSHVKFCQGFEKVQYTFCG